MIGIYFLYKDDVVVYVGQSKDIERRISQHEKLKDFDYHRFILCDKDLLDSAEEAFILKYKPTLNKRFFGICSFEDAETIRERKRIPSRDANKNATSVNVLSKYFNTTFEAMRQLQRKHEAGLESLWTIYIKAYKWDKGITK